MVSNTLKRSRLMNGEAETNIHDQRDSILVQGFNGRQGNLGSVGISAITCQDDEDSQDISGSSTKETACNKRARQHNDVTLEDIYNKQGDFDDDDDDSDWEPHASTCQDEVSQDISGSSAKETVCNKKARQHNDLTLEDIYNKQGDFDDDDDDDDSDWEPQPLQRPVALIKWYCVNCTMLNPDGVVHCNICGEHQRSGILKHGFLASPLEELCLNQNGPEVTGKSKASCSRNFASNYSTAVGFDERMLLHFEIELKPQLHPERPDRLRAIAASLASAGIFPGKCYPILAREITREELEKVHSVENIESVELTTHAISSYFTPDTYANKHSACAARLAAGLCADLATSIFSGRVKNGFALVRPPGHHAGVNQAMGFCLHNNAAIAASAALVAGAKKVLIVDWDVHHGNGTQEIFEKNKSVLYISLHRHEGGNFYPGTGATDQVGYMGAEGYCVNIPWSRGGVGDNDYFFAFQHVVLPIASKFGPDFTIISAGFDAARGDPLGCCDVTPAGYAQMTQMLNSFSCGKLLVILEGGYNLRSISSSATAVVKVLLGENPCVVENSIPSRSGLRTVLEVLKIQMNFWPTLGSIFSELQSRWGSYVSLDKKKRVKRRQYVVPVWWKLGRKRMLYYINREQYRLKLKW